MAKTYTNEEMGRLLKQSNPGKFDNYSDSFLGSDFFKKHPQYAQKQLQESTLGGIAKGVGKSATSLVKETSGLGERLLGTLGKAILPKAAERAIGIENAPVLSDMFRQQAPQTGAEGLQGDIEQRLDIVPGSLTEARTGAQTIGKVGGDIAQFLLTPQGKITAAGKALQAIPKVQQAGKLTQFGARIAPQVATDVGIATAQTGDIRQGALAGGVSAGLPVIGAGLRATKNTVSPFFKNTLDGIVGSTTGVKGGAVSQLRKNPQAVVRFAREAADNPEAFQTGLLERATTGLNKLVKQRADEYTKRLNTIKASTQQLDGILQVTRQTGRDIAEQFDIVIKAPDDLARGKKGLNEISFDNSTIVEGRNAIEKAFEDVYTWTDVTPAGLDKLKRRLGSYVEQLKSADKSEARSVVRQLRDSVREGMDNNVPGYRDMTQGYRNASNLLEELQSTFSLKPGRAKETQIKKILSSLRDNNENRKALLDVLDPQFADAVAGLQFSQATPRGLAGVITPQSVFMGGALLSGVNLLTNPGFWAFMALSSPRLVAELAGVVSQIPKVQLRTGRLAPQFDDAIKAILLRASQEIGQGQRPSEESPAELMQ